MSLSIRARATALAVSVVLALVAGGQLARADGEAGLVVDFDGEIVTYCIGFTGDSVTGAQLLAEAGLSVNQFNGLVCSIDGTGCTHSGSFASCTCQCKPGSSDCTYWSFFNQTYGGSWVYSANGSQLSRSRDGDMQAWRWAKSGPPSSAPPDGYTFEQVCGHSPRGGVEPTPTDVPPTATAEPPTPTSTSPSTSVPATNEPASTPLITITAAASAAAAETTVDPATAPATESSTAAASSPSPGTSPSPADSSPSPAKGATPDGSNRDDESNLTDGGSNLGTIAAFVAIAGVMVAAIGAAVIRGRRS